MADTKTNQLLTHCPHCKRSISLAEKSFQESKDVKTNEVNLFAKIDCPCGWTKTFKIEMLKEV